MRNGSTWPELSLRIAPQRSTDDADDADDAADDDDDGDGDASGAWADAMQVGTGPLLARWRGRSSRQCNGKATQRSKSRAPSNSARCMTRAVAQQRALHGIGLACFFGGAAAAAERKPFAVRPVDAQGDAAGPSRSGREYSPPGAPPAPCPAVTGPSGIGPSGNGPSGTAPSGTAAKWDSGQVGLGAFRAAAPATAPHLSRSFRIGARPWPPRRSAYDHHCGACAPWPRPRLKSPARPTPQESRARQSVARARNV